MSTFSNSFASLSYYKSSLKGTVEDYVISFNATQFVIEDTIWETSELVHKLIASFKGKRVFGRLIAKINFVHFNSETNQEEIRHYHFPSYRAEEIEDVDEFFVGHMTKIASRLDTFTSNGSNLVIKNIERIHIQLSVFN